MCCTLIKYNYICFMKSQRTRVYKLKTLPKNILAKDIMSVKTYYLKHKCSQSSVYMKIDRVLSKKSRWENFIAYRKDDDIVIVELTT